MRPSPVLTIDLAAVAANYRLLAQRFTGPECASVVKADAYGLGVDRVAPALAKAGCRTFFVATLEEGVKLRSILPEAHIFVFHGPYPGEEADYPAHRLLPVINSLPQYERWRNTGAPFALHVDTGMNRLGLSLLELQGLSGPAPALLMSHLACGNEPDHPLTSLQLERFLAAAQKFPGVPASLCNSSGIFLPESYHFSLARPGCALYGINPASGENPMHGVAKLTAPILQLRTLEKDEPVGYGATCILPRGSRVATVQLGYADGLLRSLSNHGFATISGIRTAFAGRVSMDMVMLDVSHVPESSLTTATEVEFLGASIPVDAMAEAAGTIGYEVFTRLGSRVSREYLPA